VVYQRAKLLKYLKRTDRDRYERVSERLGLEPGGVDGELVVLRVFHVLGRLDQSLYQPPLNFQEQPTLKRMTPPENVSRHKPCHKLRIQSRSVNSVTAYKNTCPLDHVVNVMWREVGFVPCFVQFLRLRR
jgi:hypothetical protein